MMAWDRFKGRWLLGEEFSFPERPENMPKMREVSRPPAWNEKTTRPQAVMHPKTGLVSAVSFGVQYWL